MTFRAVETLKQVDFIAAEDTRVTVKLLNHFGIKKPMESYHEHNLRERGEYIIGRILAGENCAVVSDAGMPCVSDPGEDLVRLCAENGIDVFVVPSANAAVSALCVSGLTTSRFSFEGFLSTNKNGRNEHLNHVKTSTNTLIFYEAPHKLLKTLRDMLTVLGDRRIAVAKELTKIHEKILRTTLSEAVDYFKQNPPRGEYVLVIEGAKQAVSEEMTFESAVEFAKELEKSGMKGSDAAKQAAAISGFKKGDIYKELI
jgi:16S rRNA (cytidine1402-2'-O)-methyltransferase